MALCPGGPAALLSAPLAELCDGENPGRQMRCDNRACVGVLSHGGITLPAVIVDKLEDGCPTFPVGSDDLVKLDLLSPQQDH